MRTDTKKIQPTHDTFSVSPVSNLGSNQIHNEERPTMDINDLFDGIMKSINLFADEIAEQRLQKKMQDTGRGQENVRCQCGEF
jgi:Golgi nucleoside diphosphatase